MSWVFLEAPNRPKSEHWGPFAGLPADSATAVCYLSWCRTGKCALYLSRREPPASFVHVVPEKKRGPRHGGLELLRVYSHEGRREGLLLEATSMRRIHFIRRTRRGFIRWGSHGTWRLYVVEGQPVLHLDDFRCCSDVTITNLTFNVDPRNRGVTRMGGS